jgi:DNA-binding GntR family transcriptional regulator
LAIESLGEASALAPPLRRVSLHDEIVVRLRNMILEGVLSPGEAIPELKLCDDLQISRTPLREALKVLAAEDFVSLLPNRGAVVREILPTEISEVFEVMEALEGLIGHLVAKRASEAEIAELRALHEQLVSFKSSGEKHAYFDTNQAIHRRIAEMSGNRVLATSYAAYADKIRRARYLANQTNSRWSESVEEHAEFMRALEARDGVAFARLLQGHIRRTGDAVVAALPQAPIAKPAENRRRPA